MDKERKTMDNNKIGKGQDFEKERERILNMSEEELREELGNEEFERLAKIGKECVDLGVRVGEQIRRDIENQHDITGAEYVEVEYDKNRKVLYVHVNGITVLRICQIGRCNLD